MENDNNNHPKAKRKDNVRFVLAILNMVIVFPFVAIFGFLGTIFGTVGTANPNARGTGYLIGLGTLAYVVCSFIFLIQSIMKVKNNQKNNNNKGDTTWG